MSATLQSAVAAVRAELEAGWPVVVDSTEWTSRGDSVHVDGGVLVAAQARRYVEAIEAALPGATVARPTVLSDLGTSWSDLRWSRTCGEDPLDLHRGSRDDDLQTQWGCPAHVRHFADRDERCLVQLADGTLGWVASDRLEPATPDGDPWGMITRPASGEAIAPLASATDPLDDATRRARARLGRPYRWGGNTEAAADCSGFVQSVVYEAARVLLPKHTGDQRRLGARVAASAIEPGDLVFVRGRTKGLGHVGLALAGTAPEVPVSVIHSCLSRGRVLEDPLPDFLDRYRFTGARRIVRWEAERT